MWRERFIKRVDEEGSALAVLFPPKTYPWLLLLYLGLNLLVAHFCSPDTARADMPNIAESALQANATESLSESPAMPAIDGAAGSPAIGSLTPQETSWLNEQGWTARTNGQPAVWVSVDEQKLRLVRGNDVLFEAPCGTAENGTGSEMHSNKTPLGWHTISKRIGHDAPWGQVYRSKMPTNEVWAAGQKSDEDLVLSRILVLDGLEDGVNKGGNVDSFARYIYVHGTNEEDRVGTPSSHGCIRLRNDDIITLFDMAPEGTLLLITERKG